MREEDLRLLTGRGRFLGDTLREGTLHAAFVRAPIAHATIAGIDLPPQDDDVLLIATIDALDRDGIGPIAADAVRGFRGLDDPAWPGTFQPALARGRVRYVGEPVAVVVARTAEAARDAAEAIIVDYDALPASAARMASLPAGAPPLHAGYPSGRLPIVEFGDAAATAALMATAARRLRVEVEIPRLAGAALEPRGALAWVAPDGTLVLESGTQRPYQVRETLARALGIAPEALRIRFDDVGGGFGIKNQAYPEQVAVLWAARRLGRPVLWRASRSEDMAADAAARDTGFEAEIGLAADGTLLALAVRRSVSFGAYAGPRAVAPAINGLGLVAGPYRWRAAHVAVEGVFTNTAPTTVYRGAGRPETVTFCERAIDAAARAIGEDPVAFRQRHLLRPGETNILGVAMGDADPGRVLARAVAQHGTGAARPGRLLGTGVSLYVEDLHGAPVAAPARLTALAGDDGRLFALAAGTASNGQGHETSFPAIAARTLGIAPDRLVFLQGDTAMLAEGAGTGGSWSLTIGGNAVLLAARAAVEDGMRRAATLLEAAEADIEFDAGRFRVAGTDRVLDWAALLAASPGLSVEQRFAGDAETRPCGCHIVDVEIDPETGAVQVARLTVVQDSGVLVNATLAAGQMVGGLAQGIGAALLERMVHDGDAQLISGSLLDYALPRADDLPAMQPVFDATPAPGNPLGVKGIGEAGTTGVSAAVANAIADALARLGAAPVAMPATPAAVWQAIAAAGRSSAQRDAA